VRVSDVPVERPRLWPGVLPTAAAGLLVALFVSLGAWQLHRAEEKQAILAQMEQRGAVAPASLPDTLSDPAAWRYRPVVAEGRYDPVLQILLDNQVLDGRVGYRVLTPLRRPGRSEAVLVDRGWIPAPADRGVLPEVSVGPGLRRVQGTLYVPYGEGFRIGAVSDEVVGWPRRVQYLDFEAISRMLPYPVAPYLIRLDPGAADGYTRRWPTAPFSPDRHLGYAVQWFALAAAVLVLYLGHSLRRRNHGADDDHTA
jgi:surfeit locus 1 family protein